MHLGAKLSARFPARFPGWHRNVYRATRGRVGHGWTGFPCLLLTTVGRRSGARRHTVLTYIEFDGVPVVAGSNGGNDRAPAWLLNLREHPTVTVRVGIREWTSTAELIDPQDPDFARAWAALNELRGGRYDGYQRSTSRAIPLVRLPRADAT